MQFFPSGPSSLFLGDSIFVEGEVARKHFGLQYFRRVTSEDIVLSYDLIVDIERHGYKASTVKAVLVRLWVPNPLGNRDLL
jgi:hypothetical protein